MEAQPLVSSEMEEEEDSMMVDRGELEAQMEASLVELFENCQEHEDEFAKVILSYQHQVEKREELKELMWHLLTAFGRSAFDFPSDESEQESKDWIFKHCQEDEALDWVKHVYFTECDLKSLNPLLEENEELYKKSKKRLQKWLSE